jgi:hypothetical protein
MAISQVSGLPKLSIVDLYGSSNITDAAVQVCRRVPFSVASQYLAIFVLSHLFFFLLFSLSSFYIDFILAEPRTAGHAPLFEPPALPKGDRRRAGRARSQSSRASGTFRMNTSYTKPRVDSSSVE